MSIRPLPVEKLQRNDIQDLNSGMSVTPQRLRSDDNSFTATNHGDDLIHLDSCIDISTLHEGSDSNVFVNSEQASWAFSRTQHLDKCSPQFIKANNKAYMRELQKIKHQSNPPLTAAAIPDSAKENEIMCCKTQEKLV